MLVRVEEQLAVDRSVVDGYLGRVFAAESGASVGMVQEAMRYAVLGPAQRIRPILAMRVARMLGHACDLTIRTGVAVELLHCASLVVDDLPCMDDSAERRRQPAVHARFGEATAVLAAFGLVALAARSVVEHSVAREDCMRLLEFQIKLLKTLDCSGLLAGQALDLQAARGLSCPSYEISELKTVPLFSLAVSAGTLSASLNSDEKVLLSCFGREFGLAFQLSDDLLDGEAVDIAAFEEKLVTLRAAIAPFGAAAAGLSELVDYLHARVPAGQST